MFSIWNTKWSFNFIFLHFSLEVLYFQIKKPNVKNGTSDQQQALGGFLQDQLLQLLNCVDIFLQKTLPVFFFGGVVLFFF